MNKKLIALITAILTSLSIGGYVGMVTDSECLLADVKLQIESDVYWCGSDAEADDMKIKLKNNLDSFDYQQLPNYKAWIDSDAVFKGEITTLLTSKLDKGNLLSLNKEMYQKDSAFRTSVKEHLKDRYTTKVFNPKISRFMDFKLEEMQMVTAVIMEEAKMQGYKGEMDLKPMFESLILNK